MATSTKSPKIADSQLRLAHEVYDLLHAVGAARVKVSEADAALQAAKIRYKTKLAFLVGVPFDSLEYSNDLCRNSFVSYHVYDLSANRNCVFCGAVKGDTADSEISKNPA